MARLMLKTATDTLKARDSDPVYNLKCQKRVACIRTRDMCVCVYARGMDQMENHRQLPVPGPPSFHAAGCIVRSDRLNLANRAQAQALPMSEA